VECSPQRQKPSPSPFEPTIFHHPGPESEMDWLLEELEESGQESGNQDGQAPLMADVETWLEDPDPEVLNQLLVSSEGTSLALHDPWRTMTRRVRRNIDSDDDDDDNYRREYFCILDVPPPFRFLR
jgi:hypothetical protein